MTRCWAPTPSADTTPENERGRSKTFNFVQECSKIFNSGDTANSQKPLAASRFRFSPPIGGSTKKHFRSKTFNYVSRAWPKELCPPTLLLCLSHAFRVHQLSTNDHQPTTPPGGAYYSSKKGRLWSKKDETTLLFGLRTAEIRRPSPFWQSICRPLVCLFR